MITVCHFGIIKATHQFITFVNVLSLCHQRFCSPISNNYLLTLSASNNDFMVMAKLV